MGLWSERFGDFLLLQHFDSKLPGRDAKISNKSRIKTTRTVCICTCVASASHFLVFPAQYPVQWSAVGPVATISTVNLPGLHSAS